MIIPITDDELRHYGVLGMKWGIRKDRGTRGLTRNVSQKVRREQAQQILDKNKLTLSKSDETAAKWAASSEITKAKTSIALGVASTILTKQFNTIIGKEGSSDPMTIIKSIKNAISVYGTFELGSRITTSRFKNDGIKDPSKKNYKVNPEHIAVMTFQALNLIGPIFASIAETKFNNSRLEQRAKIEKVMTELGKEPLSKASEQIFTGAISKNEYDKILEMMKDMPETGL